MPAILKLIDTNCAFGKSGYHIQLSAQGGDNLSQRRYLHVGLTLEFREARLFDAQSLGHLALALASKLPYFTKQKFTQQFFCPHCRASLRSFVCRALHQFVK